MNNATNTLKPLSALQMELDNQTSSHKSEFLTINTDDLMAKKRELNLAK